MDLILKNAKNEALDLLKHKDKFILSGAEELHGVNLSYAENESPYIDGTSVDNVRALPRGILLTFTLQGDIQESRNYFKSFIKSKQQMTLEQVTEAQDIQIKGVARIPTYNTMVQLNKIQLELYCGYPYWEDIHQVVITISEVIDLLYFPMEGIPFGKISNYTGNTVGRPFGVINTNKTKTFNNDGDVSTGVTMEIVALSTVTNPKIACSTGEQNGWYMQVNVTMQDNDTIEIVTTKGKKSIKYNGSDTINGVPVLSLLEFRGLDWLQLEIGENTFEVLSDDDNFNAYFNITFKRLYE